MDRYLMDNFDVVVIGAGPGGYVSAIRAAQLGMKVAVVEKEHLGGICLNWGCIPTKALLKSAELYQKMQHSEIYGISVKDVRFDINKIVEHSLGISKQLVTGISALLKKNKVTVIEGKAKFLSNQEIEISSNGSKTAKLQAKNFIIATGATARILPGYEPDAKTIWTYKEALRPKSVPKSLVIVGSGAIGIEFACFYNALGADVTVLEAQNRILPVEDAEISVIARKAFEKKGIKFATSVNLKGQKTSSGMVELTYEIGGKQEQILSEKLLMAVGIVANTENLGLENTKVKLDRGRILTGDYLETAEANIYAIGDVAGAPWLAHKASHEGIIAAEKIAGLNPHKMKTENIPGCTYSSPQIASVGLTEEQAIQAGYKVKIGRFPFYGNGKALIMGDKEGMIKTIFDERTGEILGAHMVGTDVTELIQGYVIAKEMEGTEYDLINTIFPHPTLSEMMHESVLSALGRQIHL